ncbi:MAG: hypothetical protein LQ342_004035 [Letrouitia transgressa]|nr:MAG: hypothetical protein LQ342_004035 [Letrouitia transgressa]
MDSQTSAGSMDGEEKSCRAGDACPFIHNTTVLESARDKSGTGQGGEGNAKSSSKPVAASTIKPTGSSDGETLRPQPGRRYVPPPVDRARIVQKPVSRLERENPREFQLQQLRRRFSTVEESEHGGSAFAFKLIPSDPDFPFELTALDCVLHIPSGYPKYGNPSLDVNNREMGRGYQINVERGFDAIAKRMPQRTLLDLVNALDKQLESLLTEQKAETIKIIPNANTTSSAWQQAETVEPVQQHSDQRPSYTPGQQQAAQARRETELRQVEARLGRLPSFRKQPDGVSYNIPISPRNTAELPVPLQIIKSVTLLIPLSYPLQPCRIELPGISREAASNTENAFGRRAKEHPETSLMEHINHLAQNMHKMSTDDIEHDEESEGVKLPVESLDLSNDEGANRPLLEGESQDDRDHIRIIPRPPEWADGNENRNTSDSDESDSYESDDESSDQDNPMAPATAPESTPTSQSAERGLALSFPSLELHNVELLELISLSITVKCTRCKTAVDVTNLQPSTTRSESCSKCAQPFALTYRRELMHGRSFRAGYVDLDGCTVADMLPSTFIPTCASCSTSITSPGVVTVRGSAPAIAICRECHLRLSFKLPETRFQLVSTAHPRSLAPQRKKPREQLGIVAGTELPRRGRCTHYGKSYRWFRFSCCGKVYACDKCHDKAQDHPNEHANRMICGFCSREQNYRPEDCGVCRNVLIGKRGSGFWEGGKGTRDKVRMSRKGTCSS